MEYVHAAYEEIYIFLTNFKPLYHLKLFLGYLLEHKIFTLREVAIFLYVRSRCQKHARRKLIAVWSLKCMPKYIVSRLIIWD